MLLHNGMLSTYACDSLVICEYNMCLHTYIFFTLSTFKIFEKSWITSFRTLKKYDRVTGNINVRMYKEQAVVNITYLVNIDKTNTQKRYLQVHTHTHD